MNIVLPEYLWRRISKALKKAQGKIYVGDPNFDILGALALVIDREFERKNKRNWQRQYRKQKTLQKNEIKNADQ